MEDFGSSNILFFCFVLLLFSASVFCDVEYALPDEFFINSGSDSSAHYGGRTFVGDVSHGKFTVSSGHVERDEGPSSSQLELYRSARIFGSPAWYEFDVVRNGTFVVRFHFAPILSVRNAADARFSVFASGFSLLSNFTAGNGGNGSDSPLIEEFLVTCKVGKFKVHFVPNENSSAFVNALEFFLAPPGFIPESATSVPRAGRNGDDHGLLLFPLRLVHRINVGGPNIMADNDTLLRRWIPDDSYLSDKETARNTRLFPLRPRYGRPGATEFEGPDFVYKTAKEMNIDNNSETNFFVISWKFDVRKGAKHLVRVHFCDIVSQSPNSNFRFSLYLDGVFSEKIAPSEVASQNAVPFYKDYEVVSDDSGFINVSVGPRRDSEIENAFLNGVEIMELIERKASDHSSSKSRLFIILGSVVGVVVFVLVVVIAVIIWLRRRRRLKGVEVFDRPLMPFYGGSSSYTKTTDKTVTALPLVDLNLGLKIHFSEILYATKNFNSKLIIGEGGFGKVFKGMLRNGTKVAVKRSEPGSEQGLPEFQTEIVLLSKIRHNHLVSLIGYCDERDEMILVYEFMENGTLRDHLYKVSSKGSTSQSELSWDQRIRICIGAAKGIHYLHTGSSGGIIHRDIKSTNILLDERHVAKVADFGLSRSGHLDQSHVSTDVKGSFGYLDPECFKCLQFTQKSDVYSFGVVLLEILCARPAINHSLPSEQVSLADWGTSRLQRAKLDTIVDPFLKGKINADSLRKFGETVGKCLQECGADRPNMVDVLWDLEYCLQLQHTVLPREPYEDSTTDIAIPMPVIQRLPSHNIPADDDDESHSFADASQVNASEVFSLLKIDEAR